jgi:hypothetical protein
MLYVSPDGNYGNADGLVIVDDNVDNHLFNYLDDVSDWIRPDYVQWFADNDHQFEEEQGMEFACAVCEEWINDFKSIQS